MGLKLEIENILNKGDWFAIHHSSQTGVQLADGCDEELEN